MITDQQLQDIAGRTVYDVNGDKIGKAGQLYLDDETGAPEWLTVNTGFFGTSESFVPLREASVEGDGVRVPYEKGQVKDAPRLADDGHLDPEDEDQLYTYYGLAAGRTSGRGIDDRGIDNRDIDDRDIDDRGTEYRGTEYRGTEYISTEADVADADVARGRRESVGHDTSGPTTDSAMTRSEERLNVGTERREAGRARLRKYVTTEQQEVSVPVTRERVRVETEPITEANKGAATRGPDISEEEHEVVLTEERPVVTTEAVPVERVRLGTEEVTETEQVSGEVRKEVIDLDADEKTRTKR